MANKNLKSIKFPGLSDTYVVPQIDSTLTQTGRPADAKATGDAISALGDSVDTEIDALKEDLTRAFPHDTVSGAVASFADGADDVPMDSVIVSIDPVQEGSGDPSPTNVRPILGWSEVNVQRTGKNLIELSPTTQTVNGVTFTVNDDGTISLSGTATQNTNYFLSSGERSFINGSFVLSGCPSGGSASTYYLRIDNATGGVLAADYGDGRQFTISDGKIYTVFINVKSGVNTNGLVFKPMIELGTTATTYEPYSGQSINIQLGQTVYGGTLDVTTGVLTVTHKRVDMGTLTWTYQESATSALSRFVTTSIASDVSKKQTENGYAVMLDILAPILKASIEPVYSRSIDNTMCVATSNGYLYAICTTYDSASDFTTAVTGMSLVYRLATPIIVQLTPNELSTLLGANNIWADTGDSTVEYRADPTLYIQRLTEPDADMIADANITSGSYFMVGNTLYKATANIASGGAITPNVNCTRKLLSEALNELNA